MIILYTWDINQIGGIETSFYELALYLKGKGYRVAVRYGTASPMRVKHYKEAGIDIAHEKTEVCDLLLAGSIWRRPTHIRAKTIVQQVHADWSDDYWKGAPDAIRMIKRASPEVDAFACVSKSASRFVRKYTDKPVFTMYNIAPKRTEIDRDPQQIIAAFTRMTPEKGRKNYELLANHIKGYRLVCYTNGDVPAGWEKREPVADIKTVLGEVDYVASLADTESFGYTIAEANACGVPCIIKRTHGTDEFFQGNIVVDDIKEIKLGGTKVGYNLREITEKSVDRALTRIKTLPKRDIITVMRTFRDLKDKITRYPGEIFAVSHARAETLKGRGLVK